MGVQKKYEAYLDKLGNYPMLGKGKCGQVYALDDKICIKVNKDCEVNKKEAKLYKL